MTLLLLFAGGGEESPTPPTPPAPRVFSYSGYEPKELSLVIYDPARGTFNPKQVFVGNYQRAVSQWQFEINANGGFGNSGFTFVDKKRQIIDWYENGLGRHVECYNPRHSLIYAGFVNKVRINYGGLSAERGPIMEVVNRTSLLYTPLDITVFPPVEGIPRSTTIIEDEASQAKYGIYERVLNGGTIPDEDADQIQATYLAENAFPKTNNAQIVLGSSQQPLSISIECMGYGEYLRAYVYNQRESASSITITTKIQNVLGADPNGIFSTDYSNIDVNNFLVSSYEGDNRDALTILQGLLTVGDINDVRYLLGVYDTQRVHYNPVPSEIEYLQHLSERKQKVETIHGEFVDPWDVKPGKWLKYADFQIGAAKPTFDRNDPNVMFIESVRFTAPYGLAFSGGATDKLPQKLAKWGLGGI